MDQLTQILKVTGVPGPEFVQKLDSPEVEQTPVISCCNETEKMSDFSCSVEVLAFSLNQTNVFFQVLILKFTAVSGSELKRELVP